MTDQETLQHAIEVAVKRGFDLWGGEIEKWRVIEPLNRSLYLSIFKWNRRTDAFDGDSTFEEKYTIDDILFDHSFAKALFGEEEHPIYAHREDNGTRMMYMWEYHLLQLVLSIDRIAYLKEYMKEQGI
mgnify:CR=1 FL=1